MRFNACYRLPIRHIRAGLCKSVDASFANDIEAKEFLEDPEGYLNRIDETGEITKVADLYNNRVYESSFGRKTNGTKS